MSNFYSQVEIMKYITEEKEAVRTDILYDLSYAKYIYMCTHIYINIWGGRVLKA